MKTLLITATLLLLLLQPLHSQEIQCTVTANLDALNAESRENLIDFVPQLEQYINSYRWTNEDLGGDKIACAFTIQFQASPKDGRYTVQAFIGSQRKIFKSDRSTALLRILDDKWEFDYLRSQPLAHTEGRFDPLTSFIDYYINIILGYDFESYRAGDGTPYFQKAADIVSKGRNGGKGWDVATGTAFSRSQFSDELLNPGFRDFREALEKYHYNGLDMMFKGEEKPKKEILSALEKIGNLQKKINQKSQVVKIFFDTKYLEIAETFIGYPDATVFAKLQAIDPSHQQTYEEYSKKTAPDTKP
jgi:hypothetical protein